MNGDAITEPLATNPPWMFAVLGRATAALQGFLQVAFPFVAVQHGMSVAAVAAIIGASYLAIPFKLLWSPVLDMTGTLRGWIVAGGLLTMLCLLILILAPIDAAGVPLLAVLAFMASTAAQVANAAAGGLLVLTVEDRRLGPASAWLQSGDGLMQGASGGIGLWIAVHGGLPLAAGFFVAAILPTFMLVAIASEPPRTLRHFNFSQRIVAIGREAIDLARTRRGLWVLLVAATPIGAGGLSFLWSAIAPEWHADAAVVAATTGIGAAGASAVGALLYGRLFAQSERTRSFLAIGTGMVLAALLIAVLPRVPTMFVIGTMIYTVLLGMAWTAYGAMQYETVAGGAAATKNAIVNAVGNLPTTYLPVLLGLVHDRWSMTAMFLCEAGLTIIFLIGFTAIGPGARRVTAPALAVGA